jgi:hypothetical protein
VDDDEEIELAKRDFLKRKPTKLERLRNQFSEIEDDSASPTKLFLGLMH